MTRKLRPYDEPPPRRLTLIPRSPGSAAITFFVLGVLWLLIATGLGALAAGLSLFPQSFELPLLLGFSFEFSPERVEAAFRNALVFGWLGNAGFAAICFITPRAVGRPLFGERLAFLAALVWNLMAVGPGLTGLYVFEIADVQPLTEFLFLFDLAALLALTLMNGVFWITVLGARRIYVGTWFFGGALLAVSGLIFIGIIPEVIAAVVSILVPQPAGLHADVTGAIGRFVGDGIGAFWTTGVTLGVLHYVVPRVSAAPLYSSGMAWLALVTWFVLAGGSTFRGLVGEAVPYAVTSLGIVSTMLLVVPVFLTAANLLLSLRGRLTLGLSPGPIGFALFSLTFLVAHAVLDAIGALRPTRFLLGATDWYFGALLLSALGAATFAHFALVDHALPRLLRRSWRDGILTMAQLWSAFVGVALATLLMMFGAIAHGGMLLEGAAPEVIDGTLFWFRLVVAGGLGLTSLAAAALLLNLFLMYTRARPARYAPVAASQPTPPGTAVVPAGR
jgi:cytochrome c oxidase cbb3-type subunit 1